MTSFLTVLAQIGFQVVLLTLPPYASFLTSCSVLESTLRYIGLVQLDKLEILPIIIWLGPEVVMLVVSLFIYIVIGKLVFGAEDFVDAAALGLDDPHRKRNFPIQKGRFVVAFGKSSLHLLRT